MLANFGILFGYLTAALFLCSGKAPLPLSGVTRAHGVLFFFLCAMTHVELAVHAYLREPLVIDDPIPWHVWIIHLPQAYSIIAFLGFFGRDAMRLAVHNERVDVAAEMGGEEAP